MCSSDDLGSGGRKLVVGRVGGFEAIVQAMTVWPDSRGVQAKACETIIVLVSGHAVFAEPSADLCARAGAAGAVPAIVGALKRHGRNDRDLYKVGCGALKFVTFHDKQLRRQARKSGAKWEWY